MTPEHAALRRSVVGASEVASVLGLSMVPPPAQVLRAKIDPDYSWDGTASTDMGTALEPAIRDLAARTLGCRIDLAPWVRHPDLPNVGASPDGLATYSEWLRRNVEIKCISRHSPTYADWGDDGTDQVPHPYWCQAQVQMACTGLHETDLAALVAGELRLYVVRHDVDVARQLCEGAQDWYERHVLDGQPLPPDSSEAYAELLRYRYPRDNGQTLVGGDDVAALVASWRDARDARLAAEKEESEYYAQLTTLLGSASALETSVGVVSYKSQKSAPRVDWAALCKAKGITESVVKEFTSQGSHRVLRFKGVK